MGKNTLSVVPDKTFITTDQEVLGVPRCDYLINRVVLGVGRHVNGRVEGDFFSMPAFPLRLLPPH